ncbi:MAG TPA: L-2-amino-thiazoline-4-carboxylic acid hydrolase [Terriglobales bacterium]|nr:L-2-amino-thiazoline-4-carboxylic acid hydrolase [Terriglobales bacterium]
MSEHVSSPFSGRRAFLRVVLPGGALLCLGGRCLIGSPRAQEKPATAGPKHKFFSDSGLTFAEVFRTAYGNNLPIWRGLEKELGKEKFVALMKRVIDEEVLKESAETAKRLGRNDLAAYVQDLKKPDRFWSNALTFEIVEDTPKAFEVKITECLWAKTYRDAKAADLGYLLSCYGDYASASGFNPKMRMIRTKTLMQGDPFCNHRYVVEG